MNTKHNRADEQADRDQRLAAGLEAVRRRYTVDDQADDDCVDRDDMCIVVWRDRDGAAYRAAICGECVLTGPEHASLSDDALYDVAEHEARRARLLRKP